MSAKNPQFARFVNITRSVANAASLPAIPYYRLRSLWFYTPGFNTLWVSGGYNPIVIRQCAYNTFTPQQTAIVQAAWLEFHGLPKWTVDEWRRWKKEVCAPMYAAAREHKAQYTQKTGKVDRQRQRRLEYRQAHPDGRRKPETGTNIVNALPGTIESIASATGLKPKTVFSALARMIDDNQAIKVRRGYYARCL